MIWKRASLMAAVVPAFLALCGCDDDEPVNNPTVEVDMGDEDVLIDNNSTDPDLGDPDLVEDEPDSTEDCECAPGEVCISNETIKDTCFPRDCENEQCDAGEVCFQGLCVSESCAGLDCGGYPNVCRAGICEVGNCSDPDVQCPDGRECIEDECLLPCDDQSECAPLACLGGYCVPCSLNEDCGGELICAGEQCVEPCTTDPDACEGAEVCDEDSGLCVEACTQDSECSTTEICDTDTSLCVDEECGQEEGGSQGACGDGELCQDRRCVPVLAPLVMGLCSGCGTMASSNYSAVVVLSPVDQVSDVASTARYRLESGTLSILREQDTQ